MAKDNTTPKKTNFLRNSILLVIGLTIINVLAYNWNTQLDLTTDKRFTTTKTTESLLKNLDAPIKMSIFLVGEDVPAAFQRLAKATQDVAVNFKAISKGKIDIWTIDPNGSDTTVYETIMRYGMEGIPVTIDAGKQGTKQKMIFPWVLIENTVTGAAMPVFIQETNMPQLSRAVLSKSEMLLEYNIANAIAAVTQKNRAKIGFLTGNNQDLGYNTISAIGNLANFYILDTLNIKQTPSIPLDFNTLIVTTNNVAFDELDKFKLDQYLMQGGNILYLLNQASGTLDSFQENGNYNVLPIDLNLSDLLFNYGIRVNSDLIADGNQHEAIPLSKSGRREESVLYPWIYYPVLQGNNQHAISKNLEGVLSRFASSIDLIDQQSDVQKTVLLSTSKYAKKYSLPMPLVLTDAVKELNINEFVVPNIPVAVLLEGTFPSLYAKRLPAEVAQHLQAHPAKVVGQSNQQGKIVVVSDADIISNDIGPQGPLDLGQYLYGSFKYDNKSFLMNTVEYLSNPNNLLEARSKSFITRILDPKRVQQEKGMWQLINLAVPVSLIVILGAVWNFVRRKKYA